MSESKQPPHTIRIKRPRDEVPVASLFLTDSPAASKRVKTTPSPSPTPPSYVFRLAHTVPTFQPVAVGAPATPPPKPSAPEAEVNDRKRKSSPVVRKFTLSKKARMHPYARGGAGVIFERVREDETDTPPESSPPPPPEEKKRKKPRTHPKEKEAIKSSAPAFWKEDEELMKEMEKLVLEYLEDEKNDGIRNLPPKEDKVGGGVGGGKWEDTKKREEEEEEGFVYDVYFREEVPRGKDVLVEMKNAHDYGLLVFQGSDDEDWWYEGAREGEEESDAFVSDDEDSNAEEYYANEYPEEPDGFDDDDGMGEFAQDSDDSLDVPTYQRRRGDEEYDFENDEVEEEKEDKLARFQKGIWT